MRRTVVPWKFKGNFSKSFDYFEPCQKGFFGASGLKKTLTT
jgi:hypothetical protein